MDKIKKCTDCEEYRKGGQDFGEHCKVGKQFTPHYTRIVSRPKWCPLFKDGVGLEPRVLELERALYKSNMVGLARGNKIDRLEIDMERISKREEPIFKGQYDG